MGGSASLGPDAWGHKVSSSRSLSTSASLASMSSVTSVSSSSRNPQPTKNHLHAYHGSMNSIDSQSTTSSSPPATARPLRAWSPNPPADAHDPTSHPGVPIPTPNTTGSLRTTTKLRTEPPPPIPAMAQGPLPQTPAGQASPETAQFGSVSSMASITDRHKSRKKLPLPLQVTQVENRLSQGWVQVDDQESPESSPNAPTPPAKAFGREQQAYRQHQQHHLAQQQQQQQQHHHHHQQQPEPVMVPLSNSRMERSVTDPIQDHHQQQHGSWGSRRSADMLRSATPSSLHSGRKTPTGFDGRKTPTMDGRRTPNGLDDSTPVASSSSSGRAPFTISRTAPDPPKPEPKLRTRRSTDLLRRPSAELLGFGSRDPAAKEAKQAAREAAKEAKEAAKEAKAAQQRSLGVGQPDGTVDSRKTTPVLSLKKSSGALRSLFRSKPKEIPPELPDPLPRPSMSDLLRPYGTMPSSPASSKASSSKTRARRPSSPGLDSSGSSSLHHQRYPTPVKNELGSGSSPTGHEPRSSLAAGPPRGDAGPAAAAAGRGSSDAQARSDAPSRGDTPTRGDAPGGGSGRGSDAARADASRADAPTRDVPSRGERPTRGLPPLPPPETEPERALGGPVANLLLNATPTADTQTQGAGGGLAHAVAPQAATSPAGSTGSSSTIRQVAAAGVSARPSQDHLDEHSKGSTDASPGQTGVDWSPVKPSKSLHLLSLPEFDLDFDVTFDSFDLSGSPTTPRKVSSRSRHGSLDRGGSGSGSPTRSRSINHGHGPKDARTPTERAKRAERRRSKSFDGHGTSSKSDEPWRTRAFDESWMVPKKSKAFAPTTSSSAPALSVPAVAGNGSGGRLTPTAQAHSDTSSSSRAAPALPPPPPPPPFINATPDEGSLSHKSNQSVSHARTPSNSTSTHETSSPSPPRTPEDMHTHPAFVAMPAPGTEATAQETQPHERPFTLDPPIQLTSSMYTAESALSATKAKLEAAKPSEPKTKGKSKDKSREHKTKEPKESRSDVSGSGHTKSASSKSSRSATLPIPPPPKAKARFAADAAASSARAKGKHEATEEAPEEKKDKPKEDSEVPLWKIDDRPARPPKEYADVKEPDQLPPAKAPFASRENVRPLQTAYTTFEVDGSLTTRDIIRELDHALDTFRYPVQGTGAERSVIIRSDLLPYLNEVDKRFYHRRDEVVNRELRDVLFDWADALMFELRVEQPANERGACLEGLALVMESQCLSAHALEASRSHQEVFLQLMMRVMTFVMDKLGAKGVFHNTLLFSGRFLAFAFFRVPCVAGQLVGVLQPPRGALMRFTRPILIGQSIPEEARPQYPAHLEPLCFDNSQTYTRRLLALSLDFDTVAEKDAFHFQPGNWLRRWQSDDSELFPAFYRAYHRQLATYLSPAVEYYQSRNMNVPAHVLMRAPGYAHLATIFAKKCHSYILGSVNAVTTSSSNQHFDATESAGFRGSQKPAVLETANRRLVETMWSFASSLVAMPASGGRVIECDGSQLWGEMVDVWTKGLIAKTSLYAPKGVFCLFDLLDGIVDPVVIGSTTSPLDVAFLIGLCRTILFNAEHALTLVKAIAFIFTHWEVLTAAPEDRRELCMDILLDKKLFERLLLFWSQSVRSYVLRLVVFRLAHLHTTKDDGPSYEVEIQSVRLLQHRLDRIKRRHDELEPGLPDEKEGPLTPTGGGLPRSRSTITMVTDSPQPATKAERLLGLGLGTTEEEKETTPAKAASWWKRLGYKTPAKDAKGVTAKEKNAKGKKNKKESPALPDNAGLLPSPLPAGSPASTGSPKSQRPPAKMDTSPLLAPSPLPTTTDSSPSSVGAGSNGSGGASGSGNGNGSASPGGTRKAPPPHITTSAPPNEKPDGGSGSSSSTGGTPSGPSGAAPKATFAFEFELPTASPRSDTFDAAITASPSRRSSMTPSAPPSPSGTRSPHMSARFSKRSSLLPPQTANTLDSLGDTLAKLTRASERNDPGYPKHLHAYAIRMLAELEDAQKEYDEWWSEGGIGKVDGAPPRLAVAWPFHEGED